MSEELQNETETSLDLEAAQAEAEFNQPESSAEASAEEPKPERKDRVLAVLERKGDVFTLTATGIKEIKQKLRDYPAEELKEVWVGRKLKLKTTTQVTFG